MNENALPDRTAALIGKRAGFPSGSAPEDDPPGGDDPGIRSATRSSAGVAIWAGLSPIIAIGLCALTDSIWSVIVLFAATTILSMICLAAAPERKDRDVFAEEVEEPSGSGPAGGAPAVAEA